MSAPQAQVLEVFGKYELLRKIGHGGMAEVFLARLAGSADDAPPLVIKRLHQILESNREAVDLFLTEADVTMMLSHPNVIQVYDSGEVNDRYYMVMEYVHGRDLEQVFERLMDKNRVLHPDLAVHIMAAVLRGLDYVHRAKTATGRDLGIVHRDVTPSNIYISAAGNIKVGDFGVAKLVGVEGWTMSGSIKGKLGYLSPEQLLGEPPSPTIDLWAAAIILFELVTGQRVFTGDNDLDVMLRIRAAKVPALRKVNKEAPKELEKIFDRALHKKEKKRFATALEFLAELEAYQGTHGRTITSEELMQGLRESMA